MKKKYEAIQIYFATDSPSEMDLYKKIKNIKETHMGLSPSGYLKQLANKDLGETKVQVKEQPKKQDDISDILKDFGV